MPPRCWGSIGASDAYSRIGDGTSLWLAFHGSTSHNVYGVIMVMDVYVVNTLQATLLSSWRSPPGAGSFGAGNSVGGRRRRALAAGRSAASPGVGNGPLSSFRGQGSAARGRGRIRFPRACSPAYRGDSDGGRSPSGVGRSRCRLRSFRTRPAEPLQADVRPDDREKIRAPCFG